MQSIVETSEVSSIEGIWTGREFGVQQLSVTTAWRAAEIDRIDAASIPEIPLISFDDAKPALRGVDLWDMWPVCLPDGTTADFAGGSLWMILSAPPRQ